MADVIIKLNKFQAQFLLAELEALQESVKEFTLEANTAKEKAHWIAMSQVNEEVMRQVGNHK